MAKLARSLKKRKGGDSDPYWSNVKLLLHGDGSAGSTSIIDSSGQHTVTAYNGAAISTAQAKFGQSIYFSGDNDYIRTDTHADFALGTKSFTMEFWYFASATNVTDGIWTNGLPWGTNCIGFVDRHVGVPGKFSLWVYNQNSGQSPLRSTTSIVNNTWYHVALVRDYLTSTLKLFINGVLEATLVTTTNFDSAATRALTFGADPAAGGYPAAYMDEIRFTPGIARYSANFATKLQSAPWPNR